MSRRANESQCAVLETQETPLTLNGWHGLVPSAKLRADLAIDAGGQHGFVCSANAAVSFCPPTSWLSIARPRKDQRAAQRPLHSDLISLISSLHLWQPCQNDSMIGGRVV